VEFDTPDDYMVHYGPPLLAAQIPPPICPVCGSHRTEVVDRSEAPPTIVVRCNACGERSVLPVEESGAPVRDAVEAITGTTIIL
jgi:hypothetical protein